MSLESETQFGLSLLSLSPSTESFVISPLSVSLALSLVHAGAEGESRDEIRNAIAKGANDEQLVEHYKAVGEALLGESEVLVKIANRMFIKNDFVVKESYLENISKNFGAKAEKLDFNDSDGSAKFVNGFVEEATGGKIKDFITPDSFKDAVAFLINAIYLEAEWKNIFHTGSLVEDDFHVSEGVTKKVEFLKDRDVRRLYAENDEAEVLTLDYKDENYQFSIILPKERFGLAKLRSELTAEKLLALLKSVERVSLDIAFPKFKIEAETNLTSSLPQLGIQEIFTDSAHLEGIAANIKVSEAKHKAIIEVDEWGTKAAAATSFKMVPKCGRFGEPKRFNADHPFLFVLTHKGHVLFAGQYFA